MCDRPSIWAISGSKIPRNMPNAEDFGKCLKLIKFLFQIGKIVVHGRPKYGCVSILSCIECILVYYGTN